jgi:hypothetical protein
MAEQVFVNFRQILRHYKKLPSFQSRTSQLRAVVVEKVRRFLTN